MGWFNHARWKRSLQKWFVHGEGKNVAIYLQLEIFGVVTVTLTPPLTLQAIPLVIIVLA